MFLEDVLVGFGNFDDFGDFGDFGGEWRAQRGGF